MTDGSELILGGIFVMIGGFGLMMLANFILSKAYEVEQAKCEQHEWFQAPSGLICLKCKKSPNADIVANHDPDFY